MAKKKGFFNLQTATATVSTTLVLIVLGIVVFFALAARSVSVYVRENVNFSLLISDDMKEAEIGELLDDLKAEPFVRSAEYISKAQALEEMKAELNTDPEDFQGYNPFPASVKIKLRADYANNDSIAKIEEQLSANINIQEVLYQKNLIESMNRHIGQLELMLIGLALILGLISFALINNTIRLTVYSQRFLIYTMKLVGASRSFIRRPFMVRNFWIGVMASLLADAALWGAAAWLVLNEPHLIEVISPEVMLIVSATVLLVGVCMTLLCAYWSVNRFLSMKAAKLYYV
ncbi:MAG: permease-like cell division protein FtsX [Bacteroidaceae bacterium]|nr:permease-like cell division protein FtsX [Bacteroidaceae bacterium]MBR1542912.1 permease-like cell division protein FtsX [Bacteroidaceae bacterium]